MTMHDKKKGWSTMNREEYRNSSVSWGTMREEDLIPAFLSVLNELDKPRADAIREEYANVMTALNELDPNAICASLPSEVIEDAGYMLNEALFGALNNVAPAGTYFGASEGDGADYGFWEFDAEE